MTEPITVILLTYGTNAERTSYAVRTARALVANLVYPDLQFYVADDGSSRDHIDAVLDCFIGVNLLGWHTLPCGTYGANCNQAYLNVREKGKLTLWVEDDWQLKERFDLYSYACLLMEREDIGMVRMGYLNLGMRGSVFGHAGKLFWLLDRQADSYVFTGHPSLRHARFMDQYGSYPVGFMPGETELGYALQYRNHPQGGPEIVWPVCFSEFGVFAHIGEVQSYIG